MTQETNLYKITIDPSIQEIYECSIYQNQILNIPENSYTYKAKNLIVSTIPIENSKKVNSKNNYIEWIIKKALFNKLSQNEKLFDFNYQWSEFSSNKSLVKKKEYSFIPQYKIQVVSTIDKKYIVVEPTLRIYSKLSMLYLQENHLINDFIYPKHKAIVFIENDENRKWMRGIIHDISEGMVKVEVPDVYLGTMNVKLSRVIPRLSLSILERITKTEIREEFKKVKTTFYANEKGNIESFVTDFLIDLFPLQVGTYNVSINRTAENINELPSIKSPIKVNNKFIVERGDQKFEGTQRLATLSKITIKENFNNLPIVLFVSEDKLKLMERTIFSLNHGIRSGQYHFSMTEKFGVKLDIVDKFIVNSDEQYFEKINQYVNSTNIKHIDSFPLIYLPDHSPLYYPLKAKLASFGKISQMISKDTYDIYALWNLATNLYAKMGHTPWALAEAKDEQQADLFLGFSSSSIKTENKISRNLGYVNVFDRNGVWKCIQSSTDFLDFNKRLAVIPKIIGNAIDGSIASREIIKIIDIHYSKKFSYLEMEKCYKIIAEKIPDINSVNFISINQTHPIKIFRKLNQNCIIKLDKNKILINTSNKLDQNRIFEITVWNLPDKEITDEKLINIYFRILNMTQLNWRSVVETAEPVTLRYSEEVAKLLNHFSLTEWKTINNQLSRIPWFI